MNLPTRSGATALPALVQARLLQSFENYDIAHAPLRGDALSEGGVRLLIDLRQFDIATAPEPKAGIALSAKLIDGAGHLKAARIFEQSAAGGRAHGGARRPGVRPRL